MNIKTIIILFVGSIISVSCSQIQAPQPFGAIPSKAQLSWHEMEYFSLVCYGLNTYTEEEWAYGDVDPKLFNPTDLNTDQWAKVTSDAGMKGLILVCKHHDGFCLWPSKFTSYSVKATPWKNGQGDVLGDLAKSCKKYGLKLGVYLSPWDRNHAEYGQTEYVDYYYRQLNELMTEYGDIFEFWVDGANGGTGYYGGANEKRNIDRKTYYGYDSIFTIVNEYQPEALIFSDTGPGIRWVGNEDGIGGETNWNTINTGGKFPGGADTEFRKKLKTGEKNGERWMPAEVNTTLLWPKAWYFHTGHQPRSLSNLMELYYTSIGCGSPLDLGIAIAPSGKIRDVDVDALMKFKKQVDREFKDNLIGKAKLIAEDTRGNSDKYKIDNCSDNNGHTYWATNDGIQNVSVVIELDIPTTFNRLLMQEYIALGQRIHSFKFEIEKNGNFESIAEGTTVGYKRIIRFDSVKTNKARLTLRTDAPCITLSEIGLFNAPVLIEDPLFVVGDDGWVSLTNSNEAINYYSLAKEPGAGDFKEYTSNIELSNGGIIHYYAKDKFSNYSTDVLSKEIGIAKKKWNIVSPSNNMKSGIDNNPKSFAVMKANEIIVDLGEDKLIGGFAYLPRQDGKKDGMIFEYEFYCSKDGKKWGTPVSLGAFNNIENNPVNQKIDFDDAITAKFIRLVAISNIRESDSATIAELEVYSGD